VVVKVGPGELPEGRPPGPVFMGGESPKSWWGIWRFYDCLEGTEGAQEEGVGGKPGVGEN